MKEREQATCERCGREITWSPKRNSPMSRDSRFGMVCPRCVEAIEIARAEGAIERSKSVGEAMGWEKGGAR